MSTTTKAPGAIELLRDKAWARWTALALLAFAMFCSYIFMDILSPIKDLLQSTRGWDSTAFGTMQGSETFLNVFIFFLIFAGIILDKMGVRFTAVLSGAVMLVGATINWYALTDQFLASGLHTWFTEHLNYIPGFQELGIAPFYEGMPASAKLSAIGFIRLRCGNGGNHCQPRYRKMVQGPRDGYGDGIRDGACPSRRRHMYDFLSACGEFRRRHQRVAFGGIRRYPPCHRPDHVHRLFLHG